MCCEYTYYNCDSNLATVSGPLRIFFGTVYVILIVIKKLGFECKRLAAILFGQFLLILKHHINCNQMCRIHTASRRIFLNLFWKTRNVRAYHSTNSEIRLTMSQSIDHNIFSMCLHGRNFLNEENTCIYQSSSTHLFFFLLKNAAILQRNSSSSKSWFFCCVCETCESQTITAATTATLVKQILKWSGERARKNSRFVVVFALRVLNERRKSFVKS